MIADDHDLIRKSIAQVLSKIGFKEIHECPNGVEAIAMLKTRVVDLVFCDLYMNKASGFQVLEFARNQSTNADVPFIIVTGEAGKDDIVKVANMGAEDYLLKPFQAPDLEAKVDKVLNKYHKPTPLLHKIRRSERALREKDYETALCLVDEALQESPESARAMHLKALIVQEQSGPGAAIRIIKDNIEINPGFVKNYHALADIYLTLDNKPEAIRAMRQELEINPKQPSRQVQLAKLLHKSGDLTGSIEHYRKALLEDGRHGMALYGMGLAYGDSDNYEKAIYYFKRLRRHHPESTKSLEAIVKFALLAKNPRLAEMPLRDEKKNHPKRIDTYLVLAKLYAKTNKNDEGIDIADEALRQDPGNIDALNVKAALLVKNNDMEAAIGTFQEIIKDHPNVTSYLKLAEGLIQMGKEHEAIKNLHAALRFNQQIPQILYWLAICYSRTKQYTKSLITFQRLLNRGMNNKQITEEYTKVKKLVQRRRNTGMRPVAS